jgi:hypothetical protein
MQCACAILYCHLWPVRLYHSFLHCIINGMIFEVIEHKKCVLIFSTTFLSGTFLILKGNKRDMILNVYCIPVNYPLYLSDLMKLEFFRQIFEKYSNIKFHENPSGGSRVVPSGRTYITMLRVAFRNFANVPKNSASFYKQITRQA